MILGFRRYVDEKCAVPLLRCK